MSSDDALVRRQKITGLVREAGFCSFKDLSQILNVSEMTIRRDTQLMVNDGLIQALHGGVISKLLQFGDYNFRNRLENKRIEKKSIAQEAVGLIQSNSAIALDAGTTTFELAQILPKDQHLMVITHSLPILAVLAPRDDIELISLGGILQHNTQAFYEPKMLQAVSQFRFNILFLAMTAVRDGAMYCGNPYETEMKRALIKAADKVVLLIDSSKFQSSAGILVAPLSSVDTIIVDNGFDLRNQESLQGIEIITTPILKYET